MIGLHPFSSIEPYLLRRELQRAIAGKKENSLVFRRNTSAKSGQIRITDSLPSYICPP
jgi:hypothetical protein